MSIDHKLLQNYLDGKLPAESADKVQLFLAEHWDDPEVLSLMASHFDACRVEPSARDRKMLGAVRDRISGRQTAMRRSTRIWMSVAAAVALLVAVPASLRIGYRMHRDPDPVQWHEVSVPVAQTRSLDLPDGTHLVLNAGSRITWPESFTGGTRDIFLEGEVMANVSKDAEHPFVIHSGDVTVRVHGTSFEFRSFRGETQVQLMLLEGSVSLDVPSSEGSREVSLSPGDIAVFDREAGDVSLSRLSSGTFRPFTEGRSFSFYNTPLRDIAAELERCFGQRIVIGDGRIADKRFLAFFTNGESLEDIIGLLAKNGNLKVSRSEDGIYLYGKR